MGIPRNLRKPYGNSLLQNWSSPLMRHRSFLISKESRSIVGQEGKPYRPSPTQRSFGPTTSLCPLVIRECTVRLNRRRMLANIHGTFYEVPFWIVGQAPLYTKMRPVSTHNKQISDFTTWNGLLVLAGLKSQPSGLSARLYLLPQIGKDFALAWRNR